MPGSKTVDSRNFDCSSGTETNDDVDTGVAFPPFVEMILFQPIAACLK